MQPVIVADIAEAGLECVTVSKLAGSEALPDRCLAAVAGQAGDWWQPTFEELLAEYPERGENGGTIGSAGYRVAARRSAASSSGKRRCWCPGCGARPSECRAWVRLPGSARQLLPLLAVFEQVFGFARGFLTRVSPVRAPGTGGAWWRCRRRWPGSRRSPASARPPGSASQTRTLRQLLPVTPVLAGLLPVGGLRRGTTASVSGSIALVLALLAEATRDGSWAAIVGLPELGVVAAAELGVDLGRLALVPNLGAEVVVVVSALIDGFDLVVLGSGVAHALQQPVARRPAGRVRNRGAVLLTTGTWPGMNLEVRVSKRRWHGATDDGFGHLKFRDVVVTNRGRGAAARPQTLALQLPGPSGGVTAGQTSAGRRLTEVAGRVASRGWGRAGPPSDRHGLTGDRRSARQRRSFGRAWRVRRFRPDPTGAGKRSACLRGHWLDLDLYDKLAPYSHRYKPHGTLCEVCRAQEGLDPAERRLAEWAHLDVAAQHARKPLLTTSWCWFSTGHRRDAQRQARTSSRWPRGRHRDRLDLRVLPDGHPRLRSCHRRAPPPRLRPHTRCGRGRGRPRPGQSMDGAAAQRTCGPIVPGANRDAPHRSAVRTPR
jgi:hypothetical protein